MSRFFIMPATERGSSVGGARRLWAEEREEEEVLDLGRAPAPVALHHTRNEEMVGKWTQSKVSDACSDLFVQPIYMYA
jgi:hypothetical protein